MELKRLALAPLALGVVTALAAGQLLLGAEGLAAFRAQSDARASREENIVTIRDVAELRPRTDGERWRAEYFSGDGVSRETPGSALELLRLGYSRLAVPERAVPPPPPGSVFPTEEEQRRERLRALACFSDLLAVGRANSSKVLLSTTGNALFTDYSVQVDRWLRPASGPARVTFSAFGGVIRFAGRVSKIDQDTNVPLSERTLFLAKSYNDPDQRDAFRLLSWTSAETVELDAIARLVPTCPAR